MLQKVGDYILYVINGDRSDAAKRTELQAAPGKSNSGGGHLYRLEHYKDILLEAKAIDQYGAINQNWRNFSQRLANASSVGDRDVVNALREFQVSTCLDANYLKLPNTYTICQFVTDRKEVKIPIADRNEIESKHGIPDYGLGIKGSIADGVYYAAQQPSAPQPSAPQPSAPQPSKPQPSKPQPSKPQPSKPQ
jgi:hypothetical protein